MSTERMTLSVEEARSMLGISRGHAYRMIETGEIPSLRLGERILIPRRAVEDMLQRASVPAS